MKQKRTILSICTIFAVQITFSQHISKSPADVRISMNNFLRENVVNFGRVNIIPQNFSIYSLGFFCKKELMLERHTKIPLRIRMGSLEHCNYLEGKKNLAISTMH